MQRRKFLKALLGLPLLPLAGRKLGYVSWTENTALSQMPDRGERFEAEIVALRDVRDPWQRLRFCARLAAPA